MSYQDSISQMQQAGFSDQEVQGWSDKQAAQLQQAGFKPDEVDSYQGKKTPIPGTPPVSGVMPTDKDFNNAATAILQGNDHPWYERLVDNLKGLHAQTAVTPEQATAFTQKVPAFGTMMSDPNWSDYADQYTRSMSSQIANGLKGVAEVGSYFDKTDPEQKRGYVFGNNIQKWVDKTFPQPAGVNTNTIGMNIAGGAGALMTMLAGGLPGAVAAGGFGGSGQSYEEAKQLGATTEKAVGQATKMGAVWGALSVADVGVFLKPIERTPGILPWITAKATQLLRSGGTFVGTNEFGDWLSHEIGQDAGIPIEYKPTWQRIVANALLGGFVGGIGHTGVKEGAKPAEAAVGAPTEPPTAPPPAAVGAKLTPAIHFDTDTWGLKDQNGEFVKTGFGSEAEAQKAAVPTPEATKPVSRLEPEVIDRYKKTVSDKAEELGFQLTPEQLNNAAKTLAEGQIREGTSRLRTSAEVDAGVPKEKNVFEPKKPEPEETPYTKIPPEPTRLIDWIKKQGGIRDDGGDISASIGGAKGRPGLIRKNGKSVDDLALRAQEAGYFSGDERPDINTLKDKIRDDHEGIPQYSLHDTNAALEYGHAIDHNHEIDQISHETGIEPKGKTHGQFWDEVNAHLSKEASAAKIDNAAEHAEKLSESWRTESLEPEEHEAMELENARKQKQNAEAQPVSSVGNEQHGAISGSESGREENAGFDRSGAGTARSANEAATDRTRAGDQHVIPGAERISDKELAERFMVGGSRSEKTQKAADEGLFDVTGRGQQDLAFHKGELNRGILSAKREEFPGFDKLMSVVDRIAPGASLHVQDLIDNGDTHGSYNYAEQLITLARTAPDVWHTLPHEAFHAIEHLLTPEERTTLLKEAADQGIMEKHKIAENYSPEDHDRELLSHLFGDYASDKIRNTTPEAKGVMDRIKDVLATIGAKVRELFGNESAKDILNKVFAGDVGQREGVADFDGLAEHKNDKATLGDALKGIRDTLTPTMAGDKAKQTEIVIRKSYGDAKRERSIAETALNEFARQANEMTPDEHMDFYNYMEGRSKGAQLKNPQFQAMADTVRDIYSRFKDNLQAMPETRMMNFVTDYFTHQWAPGQDEEIKEFMNTWWQQGSGRNLKERKIPTIADGLAYGLELDEPNPVRAVSRYAGSMSNYIASVNLLRSINNDLGGAFYADGKQPKGFEPLVGRNAERIENARVDEESGKLVPARNLHLYAPREVADLYNAFYSKGFEDTKLKSAYELARNAINTNTMMELGLSAYHFSTINVQSFNQDVGRILRNAFVGDWSGVGDAIKGLVTPGLHFVEGAKLMEQYKDLADHGVDMEQMAKLFASSNLRLGLDPLANVGTHGGFYTAWQRGELPHVMDRLKTQFTEGYGLGALKSTGEALQRVVSDVAHPLFNVYVPAIKMSGFHDLMGDWLRQNPNASDAEIAKNANRIGDMIEDRFGEMNMENIFWNKKAKELLGLSLRAPGWDIGLVRQVGGAGYDIYKMAEQGIKGNFDPTRLDRPLFMAGAVMTYVAMNAAMTYIKTGQSITDQKLKDWIAYATGGVHKAFGLHPERAELPGHGRELIQMAPIPGKGPLSGVEQEAINKTATLPKKLYEAASNTDWNGKPIYDPKSNSWVQRTPGVAQVAHVAEGFMPFQMEQLFEGQPPGSHLSLAERFLGVRAAGAKITAPEELKQYNERHH